MALSAELKRFMDSLACCTYNGAQHSDVLVEETDVLAKLRKVRLQVGGGDWFSFCPDKGRDEKSRMSALLTAGKGHDHHRACDCVVVVCRGTRLTVLYLDLKSGNPVGYAGQFQSTRQFVRYALGLSEEFHGSPLRLEREQYVVLYGGSKPLPIPKRPTVPKFGTAGKTQPDKAFKREVPNDARIYLRELLG